MDTVLPRAVEVPNPLCITFKDKAVKELFGLLIMLSNICFKRKFLEIGSFSASLRLIFAGTRFLRPELAAHSPYRRLIVKLGEKWRHKLQNHFDTLVWKTSFFEIFRQNKVLGITKLCQDEGHIGSSDQSAKTFESPS